MSVIQYNAKVMEAKAINAAAAKAAVNAARPALNWQFVAVVFAAAIAWGFIVGAFA